MMIFKQMFTKIFVTKKQLLILTIVKPFYKLMFMIKKLLQKTYQNTKIKITTNKKYHQAKKVKMRHRIKKETSKKITKVTKFQKRYEVFKSLENCKTYEKPFSGICKTT